VKILRVPLPEADKFVKEFCYTKFLEEGAKLHEVNWFVLSLVY